MRGISKNIWHNNENISGNNGNILSSNIPGNNGNILSSNKNGKTRFEPSPVDDDFIPTKSLKEAIKTRPSVSEFVKVIHVLDSKGTLLLILAEVSMPKKLVVNNLHIHNLAFTSFKKELKLNTEIIKQIWA